MEHPFQSLQLVDQANMQGASEKVTEIWLKERTNDAYTDRFANSGIAEVGSHDAGGQTMLFLQGALQEVSLLKRRLLGLLSPKENEHTLQAPDETLYNLAQEKRIASIVWMQNAEIAIDTVVDAAWMQSPYVKKIGPSAVIAEQVHPLLLTKPPASHSYIDGEIKDPKTVLADVRAILQKNSRDCTVIKEYFPKNWSRLVMCMKHIHGSTSSLDALIPFSEDFVRHQNITSTIGSELVAIESTGNSHLFLETFPDVFDESHDECTLLLQQDEKFEKIKDALSHPDTFLLNLQKQLSVEGVTLQNKEEKLKSILDATNHFYVLSAKTRIASSFLSKGLKTHIHGDGRCEAEQNKDYRFSLPHNHLLQSIDRSVPKEGGLGILLYGGDHFSSSNLLKDHTRKGGYLEEYLQQIPNTAFMIIETTGYDPIASAMELHFIKGKKKKF